MKDIHLSKWEESVMELLGAPENEGKYDESQVLMLFKMHHFDPGIIYLCKKLKLEEELL